MLVDSDVLIWYLRGNAKAAEFLSTLSPLLVSAVSYMEIVQGCRSGRELAVLKKDLAVRAARIEPVTESISVRAVELVEVHFLADGLKMADALIAATAIEYGLALATANVKHFAQVPGLKLATFEV
jgi:hypothetical protein